MKRAVWGLAGVLALLAVLCAAALGLAATDGGLRWLAGAAARLSGGHLAIEGVSGRLGMPIGVETLRIETDTQRITLHRVRLEWQARALLNRRLDIDLLAAQSVRIETLKKGPPSTLPASLRAPVDVRIAAWDVARLDAVDAGKTLSFRNLHGNLDGVGRRYSLTVSATTPWAEAKGALAIDKDAPFQLQGRFTATHIEPVPAGTKLELDAALELGGQLAAIAFKADARAEGMTFLASGEAAPFARIRLPRLLVAGQGIDPRRFSADAPRADLAFSGVFEGQPGERLLGTFSLSNQLPGRLDQDRLPLADLAGAVVGDATHADFSALAVDLGEAGRFAGDGQWRDGRAALTLASARLNLAGLHRDLYPTRIRTTLRLSGDAARQTLVADVTESWGQGGFTLSLADAVLHLQDAAFSGQAGRLTASGRLALDAGRAFAVNFDATQLNPARFGKFPQARLNARGEASGALAPELRLHTQFTLPPGELDGRPVKGRGQLRYENRHLTDADIDLDLAGNLVRLKGAYGRASDRMVWNIDAPALARLNLGLAGRLASKGSVSGDPRQPRIDAAFDAGSLRLPGDIAAESLKGQLQMQAAASGAFNGTFDARGLQLAGQRIDAAHVALRGRRNAHVLEFDARLPEWRVTANLAGGLDADQQWSGRLNAAEAQGAWPMRLVAPAALVLARDRQQASNLAFTLAGGQVNVTQLHRQGAQVSTRGTLVNLPLAPLLALLESAPFATDLRASGDWNLRLGDALDGDLHLVRQSGDVRLNDPAIDLGLNRLALSARAEGSRIVASLDVDTREAGQARLEARATLERAGAGFILPRSAPLAWTAKIDVPDLRLVKAFLPVGMRADARLNAQLAGSGSLAAPRVDGRIDASRIRFAMPEEGVAITDGTLALLLADDHVRVRQGELKGQSGRIVVSGEAQLRNPQAGLELTFEKFSATNRSDRRVVVSGVTRLNLDPKRLQLTGELTADRARLEMPEAGRPTLSNDVVIVGQPPREKPVAQRFSLALDLTLKLGKDFLFKGGGLDARLGGQLRVFTVNRMLRGEGTIQVAEGRYAAYSQTLDIERGVLRFAGPVDNPAIDVLAVRKTPTVKAGVQVGGTVQRPVVKLYSDPALPDTEKLSWLVLGHGLDNGDQQEFMLMQVAAGALLSQAESINFQTKLAEALKIDSFDVRAGNGEDLASSVVSVGKRVSSRATLSYEQSLDGLSQVVKVLYQLTPRVRLEAQAGQQSSFDAFYTLEYD